MHKSHNVDGTGQHFCDLDPQVNIKGQIMYGQIMYFLVNASPKLLDLATSNFAVHRSHDEEGTGQPCE